MLKRCNWAALCAAVLSAAPVLAVDYTWATNSNGLWTTNANWSPVGNPSAATDKAMISSLAGPIGAVEVTLNANRSVGAVTIDTSTTGTNQLSLTNNTTLSLGGNLTNLGQVNVNSTASNTSISLTSSLSFGGGGKVVLGGTDAARIVGDGSSPTLTNNASHTIEGRGQIGANLMGLINAGTIQANLATRTLVIDALDAATNSNTGTLRAINGATLAFNAATFANAGGLIVADGAGSIVEFNNNASIVGGTIRGINGGTVDVAASINAFFQNVTFEGAIRGLNNSDFGVGGTITNNGSISILSTASATDVELQANTTLAGNGTLTLGGPSINAGINGIAGNFTLTNSATHRIDGKGRFGQNTVGVDNKGLIVATSTTTSLDLDPADVNLDGLGADFINTGTLRADAGANLRLQNGIYRNDNLLSADGAAALVSLEHAVTIRGGTVRGINGGVVEVAASIDVFFEDVTFTGSIRGNNNSDFGIKGLITNNGTITLDSTASATDIEVQSGNAVFAGGGTVVLGGASLYAGINGALGATLTNNATHRIEGKGRLGQNTIGIDNKGLIVATNASVSLDIDPANVSLDANGTDFINSGTLRADAGAMLRLADGIYRNDNLISANGVGASVVFEEGAIIRGGTVNGINGGVAYVGGSLNAFFENVTFNGAIRTNNNSDFGVRGTITNTGTITIESTASATDIELQADTTFAGNGTIVMGGTSLYAGINGALGSTLTNTATHRIEGKGRLGQNQIGIVNFGAIVATDAAVSLSIDPGSLPFEQRGTLRAQGVAGIELEAGTHSLISGNVQIDAGSKLVINSGANLTLNAPATFTQNGAFTIGSGGSFENKGTFSPGAGAAGLVTMTGTFINAAGSTLAINLGGQLPAEYDRIAGTGAAQLSGTLALSLINGFNPALYGGAMTIIDDNGIQITGRFSTVTGWNLSTQKRLAVVYSPFTAANVSEVTVWAAVPGDANVDGKVNFDDLLKLAQNYQSANPTSWQDGNFNYDAAVDFDDLLPLAQNYGFGTLTLGPGDFAADWALAQSLVPEPTALSGAAVLLVARRRRR